MATVYSNLQYTTVIYSIQSTSVDQNEWMIIGWWAWSPSELLPRSPVTVDISGREVSVTPIRCRAGGQEGRNVKLLKLKLSNLWMWNACVWKPSWPLPPQPMPYIYISIYHHMSRYISIDFDQICTLQRQVPWAVRICWIALRLLLGNCPIEGIWNCRVWTPLTWDLNRHTSAKDNLEIN